MADHRVQEAKGRVKEAVGRLTNRGHLVRKGQDDRSKARVKKTAGEAKNRVQETAAETKDTAARAKDKVSGAVRRGTRRK